jgi:membrane protein implicated in regulation of membrane protease activity
MSTFELTLAVVFGISSLTLILLFVLGLEHDLGNFDIGDHHDLTFDHDGDSISPFSMRSLLAFLMFFSGAGFIALWSDISVILSVIIGLLSGIVGGGTIYLLGRVLQAPGGIPIVDIQDALARNAVVTEEIPPGKTGQVKVVMPKGIGYYLAKSLDNDNISKGDEVVVEKIEGVIVFVKKRGLTVLPELSYTTEEGKHGS